MIINASPNNDIYCKYVPVINDSYEGSLDDIRFVDLQILAVMIDMDRYLGWLFSEKGMVKKASIKAVNDLGTIKDYLQQIAFTDNLLELRDINLTIIDKLIHTYDNIDTKQEEEIRKDFDECSLIYCQYLKKFEEIKDKYEDSGFKHCIAIKMADCLILAEPNEEDSILDFEKRITLLLSILDSKEYSPVLFQTFYKWRTQTQEFWHGMSNLSDIPN